MPHPFTHFIVPVILLEVYRHYFVKNKQSFPFHYILIGGFAGLLPDLDKILTYSSEHFDFLNFTTGRLFLHSVFFPLFFLILAAVFFNYKNRTLGMHHLKLRNIFLIATFGIFAHLILDMIIVGTIYPFFPLSEIKIGLNLINLLPAYLHPSFMPIMDAFLLIVWVVSLEFRHNFLRKHL